jgi:hypothetical protein
MVRVRGVEPQSHPWEGYIIAVIRHPLEPPSRIELLTYTLRMCRSTN